MGRRQVFVQFTCVLMLTPVAFVPSHAGVIRDCFGRDPTIVGTPGEDELNGTPRTDVIVGLGENDRIYGLGGRDFICGGHGHDFSYGGASPDRIKGSELTIGGPGDDVLLWWAQIVLYGGPGNDRLVGGERITEEQAENDQGEMSGGPGNDYLEGGPDMDEFTPGPGSDRVVGDREGPRSAEDTVIYEHSRSAVSVNLQRKFARGEGHDRLVSIEEVKGSRYSDRMLGTNDVDIFSGYRGNDFMGARGGDDYLDGNRGKDTARGGSGNDYCFATEFERGCE